LISGQFKENKGGNRGEGATTKANSGEMKQRRKKHHRDGNKGYRKTFEIEHKS